MRLLPSNERRCGSLPNLLLTPTSLKDYLFSLQRPAATTTRLIRRRARDWPRDGLLPLRHHFLYDFIFPLDFPGFADIWVPRQGGSNLFLSLASSESSPKPTCREWTPRERPLISPTSSNPILNAGERLLKIGTDPWTTRRSDPRHCDDFGGDAGRLPSAPQTGDEPSDSPWRSPIPSHGNFGAPEFSRSSATLHKSVRPSSSSRSSCSSLGVAMLHEEWKDTPCLRSARASGWRLASSSCRCECFARPRCCSSLRLTIPLSTASTAFVRLRCSLEEDRRAYLRVEHSSPPSVSQALFLAEHLADFPPSQIVEPWSCLVELA